METDNRVLEAEFYGTSQVRLYCPHCQRWHYHGSAGVVAGTSEHRVAHCTKPGSPYERGGYWFTVVTQQEPVG